jgi:predicted deacetylase
VAEGADVLLHGERHDEVNLPRSPFDKLRAVGRTSGEGEFLTLGTRDALQRVQRGVHTLKIHGIPPIGFVPPAWLARPGLARVVRLAGLLVTEDVSRVWLPRRGISIPSPVVRWSARSTWRAGLSRVIASTRGALEARSDLVRVALHPNDINHPWTLASVRRTLDRECARRAPVTYSQLAVADDMGYAA